MLLTQKFEKNVQVITAEDNRIDAGAAIKFKEMMRTTINAEARHVLLDLSKVNFIDSSGLGAIVAAMKLMPKTKQLDLATLSPTVEKVFKLTRLDSVFKIYDNVDDALNAYAG